MYRYRKVRALQLREFNHRYALSLDNHVSIVEALTAFCTEMRITAGTVSGIGAISSATFRFLDPVTKQYVDKTFDEQMEITNLTGNLSVKEGKPYLHLHATAGRRDYTCVGGHLLDARVNGACELVVDDFGMNEFGRRFDEETGLNLYDF
jgi:hypothetical protein